MSVLTYAQKKNVCAYLHVVKEIVSDIDKVSKNNFDHYLFSKKIIKYIQYILLQNYISR